MIDGIAKKTFVLSVLVVAISTTTAVVAAGDDGVNGVQRVSAEQLQLAEDRRRVAVYLEEQGALVSDAMIDQMIASDPGLGFLDRQSTKQQIIADGSGSAKFEIVGQQVIKVGQKASLYTHVGNDPASTGPEALLSYNWGNFLLGGGSGGYFRTNDGKVSANAASTAVIPVRTSSGLSGTTSAPVDSGSVGVHYGVYGSAKVNLAAGQMPSSLQQYGVYGSTNQPTGYGGYFVNNYDFANGDDYAQALYVKASGKSSGIIGDPRSYAATVETTNSTGPTAGLAVFLNNQQASGSSYYIGFITRNATDDGNHFAGGIRGFPTIDNKSGVEYISYNADFAEFLPRANPDKKLQSGDIVGVIRGKISRDLTGAHHIQVVSTAPVVAANMPQPDQEHLYEQVAFIGQVPVKVKGSVKAGDYIVASGKNDGLGIAVSPDNMTPEDFKMAVGQAWESSDEQGVKLINTAVGLAADDAYAYMKKQDQRIASQDQRIVSQGQRIVSLEQQLSAKMARLDRLAAQMEALTQKVAYIQSASMTASAPVK